MLDRSNDLLEEEKLMHQIVHYLDPRNKKYDSFLQKNFLFTLCVHIDFSNGCQILKQNPVFFDGRCITIIN